MQAARLGRNGHGNLYLHLRRETREEAGIQAAGRACWAAGTLGRGCGGGVRVGAFQNINRERGSGALLERDGGWACGIEHHGKISRSHIHAGAAERDHVRRTRSVVHADELPGLGSDGRRSEDNKGLHARAGIDDQRIGRERLGQTESEGWVAEAVIDHQLRRAGIGDLHRHKCSAAHRSRSQIDG